MTTDPLVHACISKNAKAAKAAIAAGADPSVRVGLRPLLAVAIEGNSKPVVRALLAGGADVRALDSKGENVLLWLVREMRDAKLLADAIARGAEVRPAGRRRLSRVGFEDWVEPNTAVFWGLPGRHRRPS